MAGLPGANPAGDGSAAGAWLARAAFYYALWVVLIGLKPLDLATGVPVAASAAWLSLRLLPAGALGHRPWLLLLQAPRLLWQSVLAGVNVAYRVFTPSLPVRPGFVQHATSLAPGPARAVFTGITGLLPGTVPCGDAANGAVVYHALDTAMDVVGDLAAEEARLAPGLGGRDDVDRERNQ